MAFVTLTDADQPARRWAKTATRPIPGCPACKESSDAEVPVAAQDRIHPASREGTGPTREPTLGGCPDGRTDALRSGLAGYVLCRERERQERADYLRSPQLESAHRVRVHRSGLRCGYSLEVTSAPSLPPGPEASERPANAVTRLGAGNARPDRPQVSWAVRSATSPMRLTRTTRHAKAWNSVLRALGAYANTAATAAPVMSPPTCAFQSIPVTTNPITRFSTMRMAIDLASKRSRFAITSVAPRRPKIAPDAPTDCWVGGLNMYEATEPPSADSR